MVVVNMINNNNLEQELKRIDSFFEKMTVEEFEKIALDCGAERICSTESSSYVSTMEFTEEKYSAKTVYRSEQPENKYSIKNEIISLKGAA